jgi:hypothetical protein
MESRVRNLLWPAPLTPFPRGDPKPPQRNASTASTRRKADPRPCDPRHLVAARGTTPVRYRAASGSDGTRPIGVTSPGTGGTAGHPMTTLLTIPCGVPRSRRLRDRRSTGPSQSRHLKEKLRVLTSDPERYTFPIASWTGLLRRTRDTSSL